MLRPRNDVGQYADLADQWWQAGGVFEPLRWLARARAELVPPAARSGAVLVDLGCGGGLLAPFVEPLGYRHVGVDLVTSNLELSRDHGISPVRADACRIPLRSGCADVVAAGELLEHVPDPEAVIAEAARLLRPGGVLVGDTIADTLTARIGMVTIAERIGTAPKNIHDPALFVAPERVGAAAHRNGLSLRVRGVHPATPGLVRWMLTRRGEVRMTPSRSLSGLYQFRGIKTG